MKNNLPGNSAINEERLNKVSIESIQDEKASHENILKSSKTTFEKTKSQLKQLFDHESAELELKRVGIHLKKLENKLKHQKQKKVQRDTIEHQPEVVE